MTEADDVAAAVIATRPVDQMQLHKILYLIQAASLAWFGESAFDERIEAWVYGPVVRGVAGHYKDWGQNPITKPYSGDPAALSGRLRWLVDYVVGNFGSLTGTKLAALVKQPGSPWIEVRGELPEDAVSDREIPAEVIQRYHRKHGLENPVPSAEEQELAERFFAGDDSAFDALCKRSAGVQPVAR